ncbi:MAG: hypothetical protein OEV93_01900 [Candidatus Moranbacteria bacterium]|nr:hypothetical protein [Candidatus Moranbacteria bacterium]
MQQFHFQHSQKKSILSLGAESAGNFSVFSKNKLFFSKDFGNLLENSNFQDLKKELLLFLKEKNVAPDIIITDIHPGYVTTELGRELSKKFKATHIQVQHHHAHTFSSIGDYLLSQKQLTPLSQLSISTLKSISMDGTGLGTDEKIWGGESFAITKTQDTISKKNTNFLLKMQRIGHLENQILLGGELAIKEPARMLVSILSKFLSKEEVFSHVKKYYNKNQFELLHSQLEQNFNCLETSSSGRILDAVSVLLEFSTNKRKFKHGPIAALSKNSTKPYLNLKPKIEKIEGQYILSTTHLFEYLTKNLHKDKNRLAATAQMYLAQGLCEMSHPSISNPESTTFFISGGVSNTKIISDYFESKGAWKNKKIPRGDAGLSVGQIFYYLLTK